MRPQLVETRAAIWPPCATVAEHPNQHSAEILSNQVTRQWVDTAGTPNQPRGPNLQSGFFLIAPSRKAADSRHATFPCQRLNSAMDLEAERSAAVMAASRPIIGTRCRRDGTQGNGERKPHHKIAISRSRRRNRYGQMSVGPNHEPNLSSAELVLSDSRPSWRCPAFTADAARDVRGIGPLLRSSRRVAVRASFSALYHSSRCTKPGLELMGRPSGRTPRWVVLARDTFVYGQFVAASPKEPSTTKWEVAAGTPVRRPLGRAASARALAADNHSSPSPLRAPSGSPRMPNGGPRNEARIAVTDFVLKRRHVAAT